MPQANQRKHSPNSPPAFRPPRGKFTPPCELVRVASRFGSNAVESPCTCQSGLSSSETRRTRCPSRQNDPSSNTMQNFPKKNGCGREWDSWSSSERKRYWNVLCHHLQL